MFSGTGVALVTPFSDDLSVDYGSLGQLVKHVSNAGVDYLVVMGTTAESPTLKSAEKVNVLACVQDNNHKKLPVVFGMGGNNTASLIDQFKAFQGQVDAFLVVTPYYNRPNQTGLKRHYEAVAEAAGKPIIMYNVPKRTGVNMEVDTVLSLANHDNIIGIKEASGGNIEQTIAIANGMPPDFLLTSGDDDLIVPFVRAGGHGVISVVANGLPEETVALVNACLDNEWDQAIEAASLLNPVLDLIFSEGNPTGIKSLLKLKGIGNGMLRLPLVEASEELENSMRKVYRK